MRKLPIALAVVGHAVIDGSQNVLPVVLPLLLDRFHLSYAQVGIAAALSAISSSIVQPAFGWVSDRWSTRWFMPAGALWSGAMMALVGFAPSYWVLLLLVILSGIGTAAFHPVASIAVTRASGAKRGLGMSFFSAAGNFGFAVGPVMGAALLSGFGLPGTLALVAPGMLTAAGLYAWRGEFDERPRLGAKEIGDPSPIPWRKVVTLCTLITFRSWGYSGLIVFIPLLVHAQGAGAEVAARALFVFLFFGALGGMLGGHLSDRLGRQPIIAVSLLAFPVLMIAAALSAGPLQWLLLAAAGMALLASFSVTVVFAQELLPRHVGLASGLSLGLAFGTGGLGVALSGLLADALGLRASIAILMLLPGVAGGLALMLSPPRTAIG
ncbi:MAG TPA: MFS transporter [Candidatus Sulfotelmatobacter sp.]|nr:MFS transporter [Candidatus Sulfotelmatobacter sp.]